MVNWIEKTQNKQVEELVKVSRINDIDIWLHLEFKDKNLKPEIKAQCKNFLKFLNLNQLILIYINQHTLSCHIPW